MFRERTRDDSLKKLKNIIQDATSLVIVDSYFFHIHKTKTETIETYNSRMNKLNKEINSILPNQLKKILIFTQKSSFNEEVFNKFKAENNSISVNICFIRNIHDRIWIVNNREYLAVGTSFNGIGLNLSFIYSVTEENDKQEVNRYFENKIIYNRKIAKIERSKYLNFFN